MPLDNITARFDVSRDRDGLDGRVSAQWAMRPDDERFVSMQDLINMLQARTDRSVSRKIPLRAIEPMMLGGDLGFAVEGVPTIATNYSFGQFCQAVEVPAGFLTRKLARVPSLAVDVLRAGMQDAAELEKAVGLLSYEPGGGVPALMRAVTGPDYGRIWDLEVAKAIDFATRESGVRWSVPTAFRTADGEGAFGRQYDCADPTRETTTLYASDRDQFGFLVDEEHPIEGGKLPNGDPDLYFRGFYWRHGECSGVPAEISTFLYRYVCMNRNVWGQRGLQKVSIRHTKYASDKFVSEMVPALQQFVNGSTDGVVSGLDAAKRARIARNDDDRLAFLSRFDFGMKEAAAIAAKSIDEEGRPIETVFDAVQAITAWARSIQHQDRRLEVEKVAGKIAAMV